MKYNEKQWKSKHSIFNYKNDCVSYIDSKTDGDNLLILHAFGTSSYDFNKTYDFFTDNCRVILPDLIGFGFSDKPNNYYFSIMDQAQMIVNLLQNLDIKELNIMSHGYSSSILSEILLLAKNTEINIKVKSVIFLNGSYSVELTKSKLPREIVENSITRDFIKIKNSYEMFKKYFRISLNDDNAISDEDFLTYWDILTYKNGQKFISFIDYTIIERKQFSKRWLNALETTNIPAFIIWGKNDNISNSYFPKKLNEIIKNSKLFMIDDCGHFPMIEKENDFRQIFKNEILKFCKTQIAS